jgi:hypothetical protein
MSVVRRTYRKGERMMKRVRSSISKRVGTLVAVVSLVVSVTMGSFAFTGAASAASVSPPTTVSTACESVKGSDLDGLPPLYRAIGVLCSDLESQLGVPIPPPAPPPGATFAALIEYGLLVGLIAIVVASV